MARVLHQLKLCVPNNCSVYVWNIRQNFQTGPNFLRALIQCYPRPIIWHLLCAPITLIAEEYKLNENFNSCPAGLAVSGLLSMSCELAAGMLPFSNKPSVKSIQSPGGRFQQSFSWKEIWRFYNGNWTKLDRRLSISGFKFVSEKKVLSTTTPHTLPARKYTQEGTNLSTAEH